MLFQFGTNQRIITFPSKSLKSSERRKSQTGLALALVWAVEKFKIYLTGLEYKLVTDHRSLEEIFSTRSKPCAQVECAVFSVQICLLSRQTEHNRLVFETIKDEPFDEESVQHLQAIQE